MTELKSSWGCRVWDGALVKSLSFVPDHNGNFLIGDAAAADVNMLVSVFMVAVNDGICQGFSQRAFNLHFASRHTPESPDEEHELVYER